MIGVGLRLVFNGGREAVTRLVVVAIAVGLGVGLLLTTLAATNAVAAWSNRHAWQWTGTAYVPAGPTAGIAPLWWHPSGDTFDGQQITRFDVAATGASSPVPPGIARDPAPGQYYASPALAALLRSTPADQLADRYPGRLAGTIGDAALPSPSSLVLIVGRTPAQLAATPYSVRVTSIATTVPVRHQGRGEPRRAALQPAQRRDPASTSDLILSVVALAVLAPVLIFIATATRLSAARREQRFAAMRLVGATRKQVSVLAAVESTVAALIGVALGFGIFFLLRAPVAGLSFIGEPFFPAELTLSPTDILLVAIGVPAAAAVAARLALRRVHISPLGVARRTTPKPPRAWRVLPLLVGFADLGYFVINGKPVSPATQVKAFVPGYLLIIVGLVIAGPWLTMVAARVMARLANRPATLIAARRLADDPEGRLPRRQRPGARPAHHHRGGRGDRHPGHREPDQVRQRNRRQHADQPARRPAARSGETPCPDRQRPDRVGHDRGGAGRVGRAAHRAAAGDRRRPERGRGPGGPGAVHSRDIPGPRRERERPRHPGPGRRHLLPAARDHARARPLPGRGGGGGVPRTGVQRPAVRLLEPQRRRLAGREHHRQQTGRPRGGRRQRRDDRLAASSGTSKDGA